jgi:hypothetical protein
MERRVHNPAPGFRMPQPFDSVKNDYAPLSPQAPFCRFKLTEALTTSMDRASADITHQWGVGARHNKADTIKVFNLEKGSDDEGTEGYEPVYVFSGAVGDSGIASWDQGQKWHIVYMLGGEQAGLVELCAQEAATRNVPYQCYLGTWDADKCLWCYDNAPTVYAVDHRLGPPLAEPNWKGLYQRMPSNVEEHNGYVYVCVSNDCEEPPEGCECEGA